MSLTKTGGGGSGRPFFIDIDRNALMQNVKDGGNRPVIKIWRGTDEHIASVNGCKLPDGSELIYSKEPILGDGARLVIRCPENPVADPSRS